MATKKAAEKPAPATVAKMTKTLIVKAMAEKLAIETKQVQTFFDALAEMATEQTREAGEFTVPGLGKLVKAERKERMGRNPQTGEEIRIAAKTTVKFRVEGSDGRHSTAQRLVVASNLSSYGSTTYFR